MTRALPSLLIGTARMPAPRGRASAPASGKADLARQLAPASADPHHAEILLIRAVQLTEPARIADVSAALRAQLSHLRQTAARPNRGQVPPDAQAVRFDTLAELIACLLLLGDNRAWWQHAAARLLGPIGGADRMLNTLCERADLVPTVILYLDHWRAAAALPRQLGDGRIARLAEAVARAWALPIAGTGGPVRHSQFRRSGPRQVATGDPPFPQKPASQAEALIRAARLLANPSAGLPQSHRAAQASAFLTAAMGLQIAPLVGPIAQDHTDSEQIPPPSNSRKLSVNDATEQSAARPPPASDRASERSQNDIPERQTPADTAPFRAGIKVPGPAPNPDAPGQKHKARPLDSDATHPVRSATPVSEVIDWGLDSNTADQAPPPLLETRWIDTQFGGVFFLWHLLDALGLPDAAIDWNMPQALGPWGLIDALARGLLRPNKAERADPIWALLAEIDGRGPDDLIGSAMTQPRHGPDKPAPTGLSEPVLRQHPIAQSLLVWLSQSLPGIRARLADALDCTTADAGCVLRRQAELHVAPAQLDVVFALDQADLPTRRAGLDIDPGWVPRLGCVVRFHYV